MRMTSKRYLFSFIFIIQCLSKSLLIKTKIYSSANKPNGWFLSVLSGKNLSRNNNNLCKLRLAQSNYYIYPTQKYSPSRRNGKRARQTVSTQCGKRAYFCCLPFLIAVNVMRKSLEIASRTFSVLEFSGVPISTVTTAGGILSGKRWTSSSAMQIMFYKKK